ncbi:MAG: hypothetical protein A2Z83_08190 [Omnitrophica bacterium GWA2_52_8]|nr:MAG: hypothetical protein A2Z83_08190 [Omnitrophica bacterium GWA2_52_8]
MDTVINGDITIGPGGDPKTIVHVHEETNSSYTGSIIVADEPKELPPVVPEGTSLGSLVIPSGESVVHPGGTYRFDSIQMDSDSTLEFTGPVTLYVDGSINIYAGNIKTASDLPGNLIINASAQHPFNSDPTGTINIYTVNPLYAAIYAPETSVSIAGSQEFYGAVVGLHVVLDLPGGGGAYYDEALSDLGGGDGNTAVNMIAWWEP